MKRCPDCGETKPASEFHKDRGQKDGLYGYCKVCSNRRAKAWARANPDKTAAQVRKWRENNRERHREVQREWRAKNPGKAAEYTRKWREDNPEKYAEKQWRSHLRRLYGITPEDYERMLGEQGGVCLLCGAGPTDKKRLCVDHCHAQGHIRGLLCQRCNRTLGLFDDDPDWFRRAADYLDGHSTPRT